MFLASPLTNSPTNEAIVVVKNVFVCRGPFLESPDKHFVKNPLFFLKTGVFICLKRIKVKITAKFRASRRLRFEDTKRIMSPEMRPKSFGTFEKRVPVAREGRVITFDTLENTLRP